MTQPAADTPRRARTTHGETPQTSPPQTQSHQVHGPSGAPRELTHSEILQVLSGLLIALFVSNVSGTVVSNALPTITRSLGATQQQYTWFVTASLLASTASTPIWGKLSDMFNKKTLLLSGIVVFILGSLLSGMASSAGLLIGSRAVQGIGLGAMQALVQTIIGTIIPPRQRGRYMAYTGATMAIATVVGPLVGGFIVDQNWLGWRWCFWSAIPFSLLAMVVLQWRLHIDEHRRPDAKVDWLGSALITAAVSLLLIWISFADHEFAYASWQTAAMLGGTVVLAGLFVLAERHAAEPIVSMRILSARTTALAVVASIAVGTGMFGASVFLGQYYQLARGYSPTAAGLMMAPMMFGVMLSSLFIGRWVSRVGKWKPFVVAGTIILAAGFLALSTVRYQTPLWQVGVSMGVAGLGIGMTMQNLVLAVQNTVDRSDIGTASATVTFFRSLGGALGIQLLGTVFSHRVTALSSQRIAALHLPVSDAATGGGSLDFSKLPTAAADALRSSYGDAIGEVFLIGASLCIISIVAVCFMKGTTLRDSWRKSGPDQIAERAEAEDASLLDKAADAVFADAVEQPATSRESLVEPPTSRDAGTQRTRTGTVTAEPA